MANHRIRRALIVDDELMMRRLLYRALNQQGFVCDSVSDGNEALKMVAANTYDAVVTDLRMPNQHGHALATHLLAMERRPVVVVHTGVVEPKLAKDLLARGVDDILFKPTDLTVLAAKVKALVQRRSEHPSSRGMLPEPAADVPSADSLHSNSVIADQSPGEGQFPPVLQTGATEAHVTPLAREARSAEAPESRPGKSLLQWVSEWMT